MINCHGVVLLTSAVIAEPQALAEVGEGCANNKDGIPHSFCPAGLNRKKRGTRKADLRRTLIQGADERIKYVTSIIGLGKGVKSLSSEEKYDSVLCDGNTSEL